MLSANPARDKNASQAREQADFERLIARAEQGRLDFDGLRELARLYRAKTAELSARRTRTSDQEVIRYLNALCLRANAHLQPPLSAAPARGGFWLDDLPGALGRTWNLQLLAAGLLLLGAVLGARLVSEDARNLAATVPAQMYEPAALQRLYESQAAREEFLRRHEAKPGMNTIFAGSLFAHNTRIGLLSLACGILAALPSVVLLIYNGLTLGGFAALFLRGSTRSAFLLWLVPHAIPELLAVVLCSAAGLALGLATLSPGRRGRAAALRAAGRDAIVLLMAAVPLFVIAAFIESFVRESNLSSATRALVAALACAALLGYALSVRWYARRSARPQLAFLAAASVIANLPRESPSNDRAAAR
jgi:uncharacterized membrane protein SpoIIM required for sporulation